MSLQKHSGDKEMDKLNKVLHNELDKLLELFAAESGLDWKPNPFTSEDTHFKKKKTELAVSFKQFQNRINHGYKVLLRHDPSAEKIFDKNLINQIASRSITELEQENSTIQELLHVKDDSLLSIYKTVKMLHEKKLEKDASDLLLFLIVINPLIPSFWEALGTLERQKANFQEASLAYLMAYDLNHESFTSLFSCLDMLLQQNDKDKAKVICDYILDQSKLEDKGDVHQRALKYKHKL